MGHCEDHFFSHENYSETIPVASYAPIMPTGAKDRENFPLAEGALWYFPLAFAAVANVSRVGNEQHNPGQPMHWSRGKSTNHADKIIRHLIDAGTMDSDGLSHTSKVAWRAMAMLQEEEEKRLGTGLPRNARFDP